MAARIGIDTGGTFTDVVRWSKQGVTVHKLPSTPSDPSRAVLAGIAAVRQHADEAVDVVHGTTVGLNAVLTGSLARTVFVTNRGCEDLIEIGRQERTDLYALAPRRPVPPVPRRLRVGVHCRRGPGGTIDTPLSNTEIARTVATVQALAPAAIAIGLLHSPADPSDELRLQRALQKAMPGVPCTASASLHAAFGEYERFSAAILNAAIAPVVSGYTRRLQAQLGNGRLRLLRSSLGILPADEAAAFPARAMFSGPAGGVLATGQIARAMRLPRVAAFDMGGTSADLCLVETATRAHDGATIAGLPLPLPTVPVHTVGCGGGSIAYVDRGGALRVGPESAGAVPGPACYGKGSDATVTDAHVALGHLGTDTLLGGGFPIDVDAGVRAIERLAKKLGMRSADAARGILTVADVTMARAILVITAERAVDPASVPLLAYGGAGGLHAAGLLARLGMPHAVLPPLPGAFSALGLALAGESAELSTAVGTRFDARSWPTLRDLARDLAKRANSLLSGPGRTHLEAAVRYRGQGAALRLPLRRSLAADFAREHQRLYGFQTDAPIEVVHLTARAEQPARSAPRNLFAPANSATFSSRRFRQRRPPVGGIPLPVHARLPVGQRVQGPAIIEETTATTLVPAGFEAHATPFGMVLRQRRPRR